VLFSPASSNLASARAKFKDAGENSTVRLERRPGKVGEGDLTGSAVTLQDKSFHFLICVGCGLSSSALWVSA